MTHRTSVKIASETRALLREFRGKEESLGVAIHRAVTAAMRHERECARAPASEQATA